MITNDTAIILAAGLFNALEIVPKPFDQRVCHWDAPAVGRAAMVSRVSWELIDIGAYLDCQEECRP